MTTCWVLYILENHWTYGNTTYGMPSILLNTEDTKMNRDFVLKEFYSLFKFPFFHFSDLHFLVYSPLKTD